MMRSMFSAVSGLRAHQTRMDVIGNNIANINTVGFKGGRVTFQEVFNQTLRAAGSPQVGRGGTNPHQVGLGISVASMDTFHVRGAVERTDYNTDLMINGSGFFLVSDDPNFLNRSFTRAGNFTLDEQGNLVTTEGFKVLGYMADENGALQARLEGLVISKAVTSDAKVSENAILEGNLDSQTQISVATANVGPDGGDTVYWEKTVDGITTFEVNPAYEEAVARETSFQVFDKLGGMHQIKLTFIKTTNNDFEVEAFYIEENGNTFHAGSPELGQSAATNLNFLPTGKLSLATTVELTIGDTLTSGAGPFTFEIDFTKLNMFANTSTVSATSIDGFKQGTLNDFAIAPSGEILGAFDNGQRRVLGQVALANFKNTSGLAKTSANMFVNTQNSGEPIIGQPGVAGFGALNPGALEMSNVDLSREFTNMITTQRGFQANSRVITTTDEMLQELVNLKR
ncbi:MAG: flagellar biosynthesis protein FlgE [Alkaliphilus sp.]|nr:flagellar hook protein FlgE [Alkaliphilus transvaalensis]MBN4069417.1 flagellar hook protein FlgE [bacterium AH-315-G05]PHS35249.1 MAG: flagellar biosynthesis protein FlgE [Alkaliphilus sp.]